MCIGSIVDRWDEAAAAKEDHNKVCDVFAVGGPLVFPELPTDADHFALADAVQNAMVDPGDFYRPVRGGDWSATYDQGWLSFPSAIQTEDPANNIAYARILEGRRPKDAVVLVPHWNARADSYIQLAKIINWIGFTVAILTLPYHHQRKRSDGMFADYFVSANLGRTVRSVRQAVSDLCGIINWLETRGVSQFYVVGASLGSCIAGLAGAFDHRVRASLLLLTAGSFAEVVWTGRATRHIGMAFRGVITLEQLKAIWSIISLDSFAPYFHRPNHDMLILSATRDQVVLPHFTSDFIGKLHKQHVAIEHTAFPCGHYSLAMPPFSLFAGARVLSFLRSVSRS